MRRLFTWLGVTLAVLLITATIAIGWLCYTRSGLVFALAQLNHLRNVHITVTDVRGRLAGPLTIAQVRIDHERAHIELDGVSITLSPGWLLSGAIAIDQASIDSARVTTLNPVTEHPERPIVFLPAFLRAHIASLLIRQGEYRHPNGYVLKVQEARASARVSRHAMQFDELMVRTTDFDLQGKASLQAHDTVLMLAANAEALYRVPNGVQLTGLISANGSIIAPARELKLQAQLQSPHQVTSNALLHFPDGQWQIDGQAQGEQVLLDAWWRRPAFSLAKVQLQYQLNGRGMHYQGDFNIPEWTTARLQLDADTRYAHRVFEVLRAEVTVPSTGVSTRTTGTITLGGAMPVLDLSSQWRSLRWPLQSSVKQALLHSAQGNLRIQGAPPYALRIAGRIAHADWPGGDLTLTSVFTPGDPSQWQIRDYLLQTLKGQARGTAEVTLRQPYAFALTLNGERLNPAELLGDWPGAVNVQARLNGHWNPAGDKAIDLRVQQLSGSLRQQSVSGRGQFFYAAMPSSPRRAASAPRLQLQARDVWLKWGSNQLQANGEWQSGQHRQQQLQLRIDAPQLAQLHPQLAGDLDLDMAFQSQAARATLRVTGHADQLHALGITARQWDLNAFLDLDNIAPSSLQMQVQRLGSATPGGFVFNQVELTGTGLMSDHQLQLRAQPASDLLPDGLQLQAELNGKHHDSDWLAQLNSLSVHDARDATVLQLEQPVSVHVTPDSSGLDNLCVRVEEGRACVRWQAQHGANDAWQLDADINNVPVALRNRVLAPNARLLARWFGSLHLAAAPGGVWQGQGQSALQQAGIRYVVNGRERLLPVRTAEATLQADAGQVRLDTELRISDQTVSSATMTLQRTNDGVLSWPLNAVLGLSSGDAQLIPVFFNDVDRAAGTMAGVLQVQGSLQQPRFSGSLRLLDGELDFYQVNLALRQLAVDGEWRNDAQTDRLTFAATGNTGVKGDQGPLRASGDFVWDGAQLGGQLRVSGERVLVADLPEYRVLASPDLLFQIQRRQIKVSGEVLIPEARLQPRDVSNTVQTSTDTRYVNEQRVIDQSPWTLQSDVRIRMGEAVNFDGLGLQGRLTGAVLTHLRSGETPLGEGELSVVDGRYEAYSRKLDIKRGRLLYNATALGDPGLDIQAERNINDATLGNITVGVYVRGVLRAPRLQFYSDTDMSQTQIVSYLLVGKPLDSLQGQDATTVRSATNTLALQGGGYLAGQLGRRIGLEEVGVETNSNNQSSLVLGKFLSPRLFISYGISLTEAINTVKLRYTLGRNWQLKAESGEEKSADLEFRIEH